MGEGADLSVVIAAGPDAPESPTLAALATTLDAAGIRHEMAVVDPAGAELPGRLAAARAPHVVVLEEPFGPLNEIVLPLWRERTTAEVLVGVDAVPSSVDRFLARWLGLPVRAVCSRNHLYDVRLLRGHVFNCRGPALRSEILVRACAEGFRVRDIALGDPASNGRPPGAVATARAHLRPFMSLWRLRNSILSADYDDRAYDSAIFLQRYWQRQRLRHVIDLVGGRSPTLDVGCGSSRILSALPAGSVGVDILLRKLRYSRRFGRGLVQASGFRLPFRDGTFSCVVCSQVIEHVPRDSPLLGELVRVLAPHGRLVLGTPDYGTWRWPAIEAVYERVAPGAYAREHVSPYTRGELVQLVESRGLALDEERSVLEAELILSFRKGPTAGRP